jgi:glycosyltransferase involved in cell wall biosynthesis
MTAANKLNVLLSAYQCGPGMGSVSQIGWEWYRRLSAECHVTLLTHVRNRPALEAAGAPLLGSAIEYIDTEWFAGPLYRLASRLFPRSEHPLFLIASLDFFVYDWVAVRQCRRLQAQGKSWDIAHAVTPVSPMAATRLHQLGAPLLLGPWNGALPSPKAFPEIMQAESKWLYPVRNFGRVIDVLVGSTRGAALILTATQATLDGVAARYRNKCRFLLENGVDLNLFQPAPWPAAPSSLVPLHIVFVGRLLPFKGVGMLLQALQGLDFPARVTIVGEGSERPALEAKTRELGLEDKVRFTGNLPLPQVAETVREAHVFCLPSVRESGGAVLLEAMAAARPVIAVDFGGPAEIVDDAVGVKLPPDGWNAVVAGLMREFEDVCLRPEVWSGKGLAGRRRVEERFSWDAKVAAAIRLYRELLEPKS